MIKKDKQTFCNEDQTKYLLSIIFTKITGGKATFCTGVVGAFEKTMMQLRYLNERFEIDHRSGNKETASSEDPEREQCTDARLGRTP